MNKDLILAIEALEKENGMSIRQSLIRQITEEFHLTE